MYGFPTTFPVFPRRSSNLDSEQKKDSYAPWDQVEINREELELLDDMLSRADRLEPIFITGLECNACEGTIDERDPDLSTCMCEEDPTEYYGMCGVRGEENKEYREEGVDVSKERFGLCQDCGLVGLMDCNGVGQCSECGGDLCDCGFCKPDIEKEIKKGQGIGDYNSGDEEQVGKTDRARTSNTGT